MRLHPALKREELTRTTGERFVDWLVAKIGNLRFLMVQTFIVVMWILLRDGFGIGIDNSGLTILNLCLSLEAATFMVVLLIAGNRQAEKDRQLANHTYEVDVEALRLLRLITTEESKLDEDLLDSHRL